MHELYGALSGVLTAILIVLFAGLFWWAWSDAPRARFDAASRLPLEEDPGQVRTDREQLP
jgi:cytochrome c oxidase cbb3-type subunit 4